MSFLKNILKKFKKVKEEPLLTVEDFKVDFKNTVKDVIDSHGFEIWDYNSLAPVYYTNGAWFISTGGGLFIPYQFDLNIKA